MMKFLLILSFFCGAQIASADELQVDIKNGLLQGRYMETKNGRQFRAFMGIPFAKPPVGNLRFEPPVPAENWDGILNATKDMPMCLQKNTFIRLSGVEGQEDCLYLNVYTSKKSEIQSLRPVMLFIHAGGFQYGTGNAFHYPPGILMDKDIVLVNINYRLGSLGFLTTGDDVVSGNNGMKDQTMALRWVHDNIKHFGGDPKRVTVFGESAGAGSTHLHMLSPLSKGLFHAAISESGSVNKIGSMLQSRKSGMQITHRLARMVNCPTKSSKEMVECLRKVKGADIVDVMNQFLEWDVDPVVIFRPVIELEHAGAFLFEDPETAMQKGSGSDVPWIVGVNSDEGALRTAGIFKLKLLEEFDNKFPDIAEFLMFRETNIKQHVKILRSFYFGGNTKLDPSHQQAITDLYTDAYFAFPIYESVKMHKKYRKNPVYFYKFSYRGTYSFTQIYGDPENNYGVCHSDELFYLFPVFDAFVPTEMSLADKKMINVMTTLWTNFATHKNPTPNSDFGVTWEPVKTNENEFLHISGDSLKMEQNIFADRMKFWEKFSVLLEEDSSRVEL